MQGEHDSHECGSNAIGNLDRAGSLLAGHPSMQVGHHAEDKCQSHGSGSQNRVA